MPNFFFIFSNFFYLNVPSSQFCSSFSLLHLISLCSSETQLKIPTTTDVKDARRQLLVEHQSKKPRTSKLPYQYNTPIGHEIMLMHFILFEKVEYLQISLKYNNFHKPLHKHKPNMNKTGW